MRKLLLKLLFLILLLPLHSVSAENTTITMNLVSKDGVGEAVGQVVVTESEHGLVFTPNLTGVTPGLHGFHVHQNPSCEPKEKNGKVVPALSAGGHYDPTDAKKHDFPGVMVTWEICLLCMQMLKVMPLILCLLRVLKSSQKFKGVL